jgi:hypothetical protein
MRLLVLICVAVGDLFVFLCPADRGWAAEAEPLPESAGCDSRRINRRGLAKHPGDPPEQRRARLQQLSISFSSKPI